MLNVAILMGRLVSDPELRHTSSDIAVTRFTIAVDRSYVKSVEERQADFIDVVAFRSTADFICKYFCKGQMIAIQGTIQTQNYTDKDGNKRKSTSILAQEVSFCGEKKNKKPEDISPPEQHEQPATKYHPEYPQEKFSDFTDVPTSDDDLPF